MSTILDTPEMRDVPDEDPVEEFRGAMRRAGLRFVGPIHADGELHRFNSRDEKGHNSWYVLIAGRPFAGLFGCWKRSLDEVWYQRNGKLSQTEWDDVRRRWQEAELKRQQSEQDRQPKARKLAAWIFRRAKPVTSHEYLMQKGVEARGEIREYRGALVLPLRDINGELHSLQFIGADGTKRFLSGGRIAGCFFAQAQAGEAKGVSVPLQITTRMEAALKAYGFSQAAINKMKPAEAHAILNGPLNDANTSDGPLVLCEGYATGASINEATGFDFACAMNTDNLLAVAQALRSKWPSREILVAADNSTDEGVTKATEAAQAVHAKLAVPTFADGSSKPEAFNDLHRLAGLDEVKRQIEAAAEPPQGKESDQQTFTRLAALSRIDYDRCRKAEADRLGIRLETLDEAVDKRRSKKSDGEPSDPSLPELEPWPSPVDGVELLDGLAGEYEGFIWLPPHGATVLSVETLYSYGWRSFEYAPILAVTSPTYGCGKGRVLEVMQHLVFNPWRTGNATESVLFRIIDARAPHVLIDEFDSLGEDTRKAIANILNQAFHVSGRVHRVEGEGERKVVEFKCFAPMVVACVKLSSFGRATVTRCIPLRMQKKPRQHKITRFRRYDGTEWRRKCLRWLNDNKARIESADVQMPEELDDRAQNIWEPFFVIAHVVGGNWPERVRQAALAMCGEDTSVEVEDTGVQLLRWCRTHFEETGSDRVSSHELCDWLNGRPDAGYSNWREGKGIDQRSLARLLAPFGITSRNIAEAGGRPKGYLKESFFDAWESYCPPEPE